MASPLVLVTGATGRQGGAVARCLLGRGLRVRILTRRPESAAAQRLATLGADPVRGDMADPASLREALRGAWGVYAVQSPCGPEGASVERRHGEALARAARDADVAVFVQSSVAGAQGPTDIPHFESKRAIERTLRRLELPTVVVRPVTYMDTYTEEPFLRRLAAEGILRLPLCPENRLHLLSLADLGQAVADVFAGANRYLGTEVPLAGDACTPIELAQTLGDALGRPVRFVEEPLRTPPMSEAAARMWAFYRRQGQVVDLAAVRRRFPYVRRFATFVTERLSSRTDDGAAVTG